MQLNGKSAKFTKGTKISENNWKRFSQFEKRSGKKERDFRGGSRVKGTSLTRGAGILLPVASLPSKYGIGTFGRAAYEFVDLLVDLHQKYWQVLPLGPTSYGDSPYQSFSAFAGNPYYIDLDILKEDGLLTKEEIEAFSWGDDEEDISYGILFKNRFPVLKKAFERFDTEDVSFREFCREQENWLDGYSFYMALKTFSENVEWTAWEPDIRDRKSKALEEYRVRLADEILFWKFCQYEFFDQWGKLRSYANNRGIRIIGDIPLYVSMDSADVWEHRELFQVDRSGKAQLVAGCPPDAFSDDGQKWGNPLYDWDKMEQEDFSWWRRRIEANAKLYDVIRFDHFIGVVRYYSVPAKDTHARNGHWRKGPGKKLTDAMAESLGESRMIVEDLGVVVPGVKRLVQRTGWPGMKILLFAFDGNADHEFLPHNYPNSNMVVYGGTHDNEPLMGFFNEKCEYELAFLYNYLNINNKEEIVDAIIRLAYGSIADVAIFQMQDLLKLGMEARTNLPATIGTNWRWRLGKKELSEERREWLRTLAIVYRR